MFLNITIRRDLSVRFLRKIKVSNQQRKAQLIVLIVIQIATVIKGITNIRDDFSL